MSSVILAADTAAIEEYHHPAARSALAAKAGAPVLRRVQGIAAGVFFLAAQVPLYVGVLLLGALVSIAGALLLVIQAIGIRLTRPLSAAVASAVALVCMAGPQRARADMVTGTPLLEQATMVFGSQTQTALDTFDAPGPGTLLVTLKDLQFPVQLQQLTASISSNDQTWSLIPSQDSPWQQLDLQIDSGGVFDAFVAAQAGTFLPGVQLGAYSLSVEFQPAAVPLPPALDLLLSGMGLLGAMTLIERISRRRNGDVISIA